MSYRIGDTATHSSVVVHLVFWVWTVAVFLAGASLFSCAPQSSHEQQVFYTPQMSQEDLTLAFLGRPLPDRLPDVVETFFDPILNQVVDRLTITSDGAVSIVYYLRAPGSKKLALYHQGHSGDFRTFGRATLDEMQDKGFAVLAFAMPLKGMNWIPGRYPTDSHENFATLPFPMRPFVEPVSVALNWVELLQLWDDVRMVGISGGGWTTATLAALDPRIEHAYAVAGMWTPELNAEHSGGRDLEQRITQPFARCIFAAAAGRLTLVYNDQDPCCFSGEFYDGFGDEIRGLSVWVVPNDQHSITPGTLNMALWNP